MCKKIPQKKKIGEHILCGYLMPIIWAFGHIEKKHISRKRLYEKVLRIFKRTSKRYN